MTIYQPDGTPLVEATDLAYLAGLIDGEGTIYWNERGSSSTLQLRVFSTYRPVLEWIFDLVPGGSIENHADEIRVTNRGGTKPCYAWVVAGPRAVVVLRNVLSYLQIKREKAIEMLGRWEDSYEDMQRPGRRVQAMERVELEMLEMGWE